MGNSVRPPWKETAPTTSSAPRKEYVNTPVPPKQSAHGRLNEKNKSECGLLVAPTSHKILITQPSRTLLTSNNGHSTGVDGGMGLHSVNGSLHPSEKEGIIGSVFGGLRNHGVHIEVALKIRPKDIGSKSHPTHVGNHGSSKLFIIIHPVPIRLSS